MTDNGRDPRSSNTRKGRDGGQGANRSDDFNAKSGAANQNADGVVRVSKAQLLSMLKQSLPKFSGNQIKTIEGEELTPTKNQRNLIASIEEKPIVMVEGTFGTGKTMWTCYMALLGLTEKKYNRICLNAPAVEAGENIGFLKGTLEEKMLPHVNQILEAFDEFIGEDLRKKLCEANIIKVEPHAFLRGRSMKKTFFILDECQNASGPNLQTALTRLGSDSTFVFMGDNRQNDRTEGNSAYTAFVNRYTKPVYAQYVAHARLGAEDVKRHPFLKLMVEQGDDAPLQGYETHKTSGQPHRAPASAPKP